MGSVSKFQKLWLPVYYEVVYRKDKRMLLSEPEKFVTERFEKYMGAPLDLENPKTFNEKLNWMKLYWYDPQAVICADKYRVREFVKARGLESILNDLYAVWDRPEDISLDQLPDEFVLKTSHDSGHIAVCTDKKTFRLKAAQRMFKNALRYDFCFFSAEWPYHTKNPVIIAEKLLKDDQAGELYDYKFYCFNGVPYCIFFASDRKNHVKADYYDLEWKPMPFRWSYEPSGKNIPAPERLKDMIEYARILSAGFPHVRVDFYQANGNVYFGEMTFFHGGGYGHYQPGEWDRILGDMIPLPEKGDPWAYIKKDYPLGK